jgi:hypothetical protein
MINIWFLQYQAGKAERERRAKKDHFKVYFLIFALFCNFALFLPSPL